MLDFRLPSNQGYWKPRNIEQTHTACRAKHCFCRPPLPRRTVFSTGTRPVEMLSAQILIAHISQCDRSLIRNFLQIWSIKKQFSAVKETVCQYSYSKEFRLDSRGPWFPKFEWVCCSSMLSFKKVVGVTRVRKQSPHVDSGGILLQWSVGKRECERRGKSGDLSSASFHRKQSSFRCGPRASFKEKIKIKIGCFGCCNGDRPEPKSVTGQIKNRWSGKTKRNRSKQVLEEFWWK